MAKRNRFILAGVTAVLAAWLTLGQAALVYAEPDPVPATTPTAQTTQPADTTQGVDLPGSGNNNTDQFIKPTCNVPDVGWLVCPLINAGTLVVQKLSSYVIDLLQVRPLIQDSSLFNSWKAIRDLANVGFILIFMVLIFSTLMSTTSSSYQLKALLPRLIIATVLVQFSFLLSGIAIDVGNVLGVGVGSIFAQLGGAPGAGQASSNYASAFIGLGVATIGAAVAVLIITWPVVLLMLGVWILSILGVFLTLAARQLLIAVLVVVSPLAMVAWVLPGTRDLFNHWYRNLIRVILLYPLIVMLLSMGNLLTRAAVGTDTNFPGVSDVNKILGSLIPIVVLLSVPAAFKWAGGIFHWAQSTYTMRGSQAASGRLRTGQLRQDLIAKRREGAFLAQRDVAKLPGDSKRTTAWKTAQRGLARAQVGEVGRGVQTRRRLAKGYDAALAAQMGDWGAIFDDQQMGNSDLMNKLVYNVKEDKFPESFSYMDASGSERTYAITKAMRAQAIGQIVKQGGTLEVSQIYNQLFDQTANNGKGGFVQDWHGMPGREVTDMWFRGLGSSGKMGEVIGSVPMVNPGKLAGAYDTLNANGVASMHGSAAGFFLKRIVADIQPSDIERQQLGKTVDSLKRERSQKLLDNLRIVAESPQLRGNIDQATLKRFKDAITPGKQDINPVTGKAELMYDGEFERLMSHEAKTTYKGRLMTGIEFLTNHVTDDGKIIS
jgi:hypothetical protein